MSADDFVAGRRLRRLFESREFVLFTSKDMILPLRRSVPLLRPCLNI